MKNVKVISVVLMLVLITEIAYVVINVDQLNIITFLLFVILVPSMLYSASIAGFLSDINIPSNRIRMFSYGGFAAMFSVVIYLILYGMNESIENIIENSVALDQGVSNVSISAIEHSTGISSYITIFLMVLIFIIIFSLWLNMLLNKMRER